MGFFDRFRPTSPQESQPRHEVRSQDSRNFDKYFSAASPEERNNIDLRKSLDKLTQDVAFGMGLHQDAQNLLKDIQILMSSKDNIDPDRVVELQERFEAMKDDTSLDRAA